VFGGKVDVCIAEVFGQVGMGAVCEGEELSVVVGWEQQVWGQYCRGLGRMG